MTNPRYPHFLSHRQTHPPLSHTLTLTYPHTKAPSYSPYADIQTGWTHPACTGPQRPLLARHHPPPPNTHTHAPTAHIHQLQTLECVATQSPTLTFSSQLTSLRAPWAFLQTNKLNPERTGLHLLLPAFNPLLAGPQNPAQTLTFSWAPGLCSSPRFTPAFPPITCNVTRDANHQEGRGLPPARPPCVLRDWQNLRAVGVVWGDAPRLGHRDPAPRYLPEPIRAQGSVLAPSAARKRRGGAVGACNPLAGLRRLLASAARGLGVQGEPFAGCRRAAWRGRPLMVRPEGLGLPPGLFTGWQPWQWLLSPRSPGLLPPSISASTPLTVLFRSCLCPFFAPSPFPIPILVLLCDT